MWEIEVLGFKVCICVNPGNPCLDRRLSRFSQIGCVRFSEFASVQIRVLRVWTAD